MIGRGDARVIGVSEEEYARERDEEEEECGTDAPPENEGGFRQHDGGEVTGCAAVRCGRKSSAVGRERGAGHSLAEERSFR